MDINEITQRKTDATRLPYFPEEDLVDGYCHDEEYEDRERDPGHRDRVLDAVGDFFKSKRRPHGR